MLSRRQMVRSLLGAPLVVITGAVSASSPTADTYGYLTPDICQDRGLDHAKAHVFLDGVDVTRAFNVQAADDRRGYIEIFSRNAQGGHFPDHTGHLARERRYGHVRVTFA